MAIKIIFFFTILAYSILASQSFMYILSLKNVQLNMSASTYIEFRKLIDASMRSSLKYVIYLALVSNLTLVILTIKNPGSLLFVAAVISFVFLIIDILLTLKASLPINDIINSWAPNNIPSNWQEFRMKWLTIFQYRQIATITGFVALIMAAAFGSK